MCESNTKMSSSSSTMIDERWAARVATDLAYAHRLDIVHEGVSDTSVVIGECTACDWYCIQRDAAMARQAHNKHLRKVVEKTINAIGVESA